MMRSIVGRESGFKLSRFLSQQLLSKSSSQCIASGQLESRIVAVSDLSDAEVATMWQLYERYYTDVSYTRFLADLNDKQNVILLSDSGNALIEGFSTVKIVKGITDKRPFVAVYSGDTIIDKRYWGQTSLQQTFFMLLLKVYVTHPGSDVYWFLISKGYKTYLLLTKNFPNCWPRPRVDTPPHVAEILHTLASAMFGDAWKSELGVLKFPDKMGSLKVGVTPLDKATLQDSDVQYFLAANPRYFEGDELCCLGRVDSSLLMYYPVKLLKKKISQLTHYSLRS